MSSTRISAAAIDSDKSEWTAMAVLTNVKLQEAIEGGLAVLAPHGDERVKALCSIHPIFRDFLNKFIDEFGKAVCPAVLLVRSDAPKSVCSAEALAGFRDAIALSVIPLSRAIRLKIPHHRGLYYSDNLNFYPWMISKNNQELICNTPAILHQQDIAPFQGHSLPGVPIHCLSDSDIDKPLFSALLKRWH